MRSFLRFVLVLTIFLLFNRRSHSLAKSCMTISTDYKIVASKLKEITQLEGISGLLGWDEMTMLPPGSSAGRGAQKEALAGVIHEKKTSEELGSLLKTLYEAGDSAELSDVAKANVRDSWMSYSRNLALPKEFVKEVAALETQGYGSWLKARTEKNFSIFQPDLQKWIDISIQRAKYLDPNSEKPIYDTLLYDYEKGMSSQRLDEIFDEVKAGVVPLINEIKTKGTSPDAAWMTGEYDTDVQARMCKDIAVDLGFDLNKGRLDVSVHPFTGGAGCEDVRMTTRFKANDLTEGLTGAIHETGHSLYEMGRNIDEEWKDQPVSTAMSMGVHESQSLLWERMVALSRPFQDYLLPKIQAAFPNSGFAGKTPEDLYHGINLVRDPSKIRVESDEVTYTMHVILRYEMEKGLLDGSIAVKDVPSVWNTKMKEYLGAASEPQNDAEGCLQDVHWSAGALGYFPTYSLGAMYACQIFKTAEQEIPDLSSKISKGEFAPLKAWLNEKIHRKGSFYENGDELMKVVTGKQLDPQIFLTYLREKYTSIYKL